MATASTPETKLPDGDSRVAELRPLSGRELRDKAKRLRSLLKGPILSRLHLPDGGEMLRLYLQAVLDELNRRQHAVGGDEAAMALPEKLPDDNSRSRVMELRQLSDRELRDKAQGLRVLLKGPMLARLPDRGKMLRLHLQAVLDELSRRQHDPIAACPRNSNGEARRGTGRDDAEQHHGPMNAATTALPEKLSSSGNVSVGGKRVRLEAEAQPQSSADQALWERVQRLQVLFAGPDGCKRLRLFLETCFREREVNNRGQAQVSNSKSRVADKLVGCEICGSSVPPRPAKAATGSPEEEPSSGKEARERVEAAELMRQLSDQALWERAQRYQEALAAGISARVPGAGTMRVCLGLEACLRELSNRHQDAH